MACEREDGLPRLRLWRFAGDGAEAAPSGEIAFPEPAYSAHPHINRVFETTTFRYAYQSLVTPSSVYEYDVAARESTLLKQLEIPGGFDRTLYASERIHAKAQDGVEVPVSIVYRLDKFAGNISSTRSSAVSRSQNRDLHPTDQDLSVGTPDLGHPEIRSTSTGTVRTGIRCRLDSAQAG